MNNNPEIGKPVVPANSMPDNTDTDDRREVLKKLGRFAAYSAPFTVLALSAKAASASGPHKHR
jgi:hypothetical protein